LEVHAWKQVYTYQVTENQLIRPEQIDLAMQHEPTSIITLLTCEGYDAFTAGYASRRLVRAVLIGITVSR